MSGSISFIPSQHPDWDATAMAYGLMALGYRLDVHRTAGGRPYMTAHPRGPVATNANVRHIPRRKRSIVGARVPGPEDLPPTPAA